MVQEKNTKQIIVKMKDGLYQELLTYCNTKHRSISEVVREAISELVFQENQNVRDRMGSGVAHGRTGIRSDGTAGLDDSGGNR